MSAKLAPPAPFPSRAGLLERNTIDVSEMPIVKVVLYKHGVGYFERAGEVEGDAAIMLELASTQMNDVLKSLTIVDHDGGQVASVRYPSTPPVGRSPETPAISLDDGASTLTNLLDQVKGARVKVELGSRTVEGAVTGVQMLERLHEGDIVRVPHLVLLLDGGALQTFDLFETKQVTLLDRSLRRDMTRLLEVLLEGARKDLKTLTISTRGEGRRRVSAGYVIEAPMWKTSYRVLLETGKTALLQGWGLVDNGHDDWRDVRLSLVAGLPVSFVHDLYSTRYPSRPVVELPTGAPYGPPVGFEAPARVGAAHEREITDGDEGRGLHRAARPLMMAAAVAPVTRHISAEAVSRTVDVQTQVGAVSDLFEYDITLPVTMRKGESALVPLLQGPVEARRVAVYRESLRARNPMSALALRNTTGVTLEGGPLTVFENGAYVGESMLDLLLADEERVVPFSVELRCSVHVERDDLSKRVSRLLVGGGLITLEHTTVHETTYHLHSKNTQPLEVHVEHPRARGARLTETQPPIVSTDEVHRFRVDLAAQASAALRVREERTESESTALSSAHPDNLDALVETRCLDAAASEEIRALAALQRDIGHTHRRIEQREREIAAIFDDQERLRKNLQALGEGSDEKMLRERYVVELASSEDRLTVYRAELGDLKEALLTRRGELETRIERMRFEGRADAPESRKSPHEAQPSLPPHASGAPPEPCDASPRSDGPDGSSAIC